MEREWISVVFKNDDDASYKGEVLYRYTLSALEGCPGCAALHWNHLPIFDKYQQIWQMEREHFGIGGSLLQSHALQKGEHQSWMRVILALDHANGAESLGYTPIIYNTAAELVKLELKDEQVFSLLNHLIRRSKIVSGMSTIDYLSSEYWFCVNEFGYWRLRSVFFSLVCTQFHELKFDSGIVEICWSWLCTAFVHVFPLITISKILLLQAKYGVSTLLYVGLGIIQLLVQCVNQCRVENKNPGLMWGYFCDAKTSGVLDTMMKELEDHLRDNLNLSRRPSFRSIGNLFKNLKISTQKTKIFTVAQQRKDFHHIDESLNRLEYTNKISKAEGNKGMTYISDETKDDRDNNQKQQINKQKVRGELDMCSKRCMDESTTTGVKNVDVPLQQFEVRKESTICYKSFTQLFKTTEHLLSRFRKAKEQREFDRSAKEMQEDKTQELTPVKPRPHFNYIGSDCKLLSNVDATTTLMSWIPEFLSCYSVRGWELGFSTETHGRNFDRLIHICQQPNLKCFILLVRELVQSSEKASVFGCIYPGPLQHGNDAANLGYLFCIEPVVRRGIYSMCTADFNCKSILNKDQSNFIFFGPQTQIDAPGIWLDESLNQGTTSPTNLSVGSLGVSNTMGGHDFEVDRLEVVVLK